MTGERLDMSLDEIIKSNRKAGTSRTGATGCIRGGGAGRRRDREKGGPRTHSRSRSRGRMAPAQGNNFGRVGKFKSRSR